MTGHDMTGHDEACERRDGKRKSLLGGVKVIALVHCSQWKQYLRIVPWYWWLFGGEKENEEDETRGGGFVGPCG